MDNIYIAHSTKIDYKSQLYLPLRESKLNNKFNIIFPHESNNFVNSKDIIKNCKIVIAEVSEPSVGVGIELGWADSFDIKIIGLCKDKTKPSNSIMEIATEIITYCNKEDMIYNLEKYLRY
jgi:hypothetical protein